MLAPGSVFYHAYNYYYRKDKFNQVYGIKTQSMHICSSKKCICQFYNIIHGIS
jgi:hypothetical protein